MGAVAGTRQSSGAPERGDLAVTAELIGILSVGLAAAALTVLRVHSLRELLRAVIRHLPGHAGDFLWRSETAAHGSAPAGGDPMSEQPGAPEQAEADQSPEEDTHDVPAPRGGTSYDPRPLEDKARRQIAYLLIALLALLVIALPAMVVFGVIAVGDVKEFGVIHGPLVALVSAATGFYYGTLGRDRTVVSAPLSTTNAARSLTR